MERCGFFDAHLEGSEYDRVYLAQHFAAYFASFISNGVYAAHSNALQVFSMAVPQMKVSVASGQAWINGYWYENMDSLQLSIDAADGVFDRIDSIVLRLGMTERDMWIAVKKGTPATNPTAPSIVRDADYYELQLATISIPARAVSITQSKITDTRMNLSACGWVTGVIQQIDTTTLFEQFQTYFEEFKELREGEFDSWFERMKDQLSEDAAGNLQEQIDDINQDILNLNQRSFTFVVDSDEALAAWQSNAAGNDYTSVLIKKGTYSRTGQYSGLNIRASNTKVIEGEAGSILYNIRIDHYVPVTSDDFYIKNVHIIGDNSYAGFMYCKNLTNCSVTHDTDIATYANGFDNCENLINCSANVTNAGYDANGFSGCKNLYGCSGAGISTSEGKYGYGFYRCKGVSYCKSVSNVVSSSDTFSTTTCTARQGSYSSTNAVANTADGGFNDLT